MTIDWNFEIVLITNEYIPEHVVSTGYCYNYHYICYNYQKDDYVCIFI